MMATQPLRASTGWSATPDAERAGAEAAQQALEGCAGVPLSLALVFGSSWFDQAAMLRGVRTVTRDALVAGISTAGEILPDGPRSHSCAVLALSGTALTCSLGVAEHAEGAPREAGQRAAYTASQGLHGAERQGFLLFGDGLLRTYSEIIRGLQEVLGTSARIAGALAGDDLQFTRTFQYANHRALTGSIVGVLLGGQVSLGVGMAHGFAPISRPRRITKASGNLLMELDHAPAAAVFEEYCGPELLQRMRQTRLTREASAFPLGIQRSATSDWMLRTVLAIRPDGGLVCNAELLEGSWLQLMIGSRQLAMNAAEEAVREALRSVNRPACVLVFNSAARRVLLGDRAAAQEIDRMREQVARSVPLIGCYTYGEQATFAQAPVYERATIQTGSVLAIALGA